MWTEEKRQDEEVEAKKEQGRDIRALTKADEDEEKKNEEEEEEVKMEEQQGGEEKCPTRCSKEGRLVPGQSG